MPPRGGPNQKAVAAKEKKAAAQAVKDAKAAAAAESAAAKDWDAGSNTRGADRAAANAAKADEAARRRREKAALLAAEEEAAGGSGKALKPQAAASKTKKGGAKAKKKKNDLSLLEDALVGDAEKKSKEKKRAERTKREREAAAAAERERRAKEARESQDPLLANTDAMLCGAGLEDGAMVGRAANVASAADVDASGVDGALAALSIESKVDDRHPEKRAKAAYRAYEERQMPEMKVRYPGLKRQQYLDKIFAEWKKSPENPRNQPLW